MKNTVTYICKTRTDSSCKQCFDSHPFVANICTPVWITIVLSLVLAVLYLKRRIKPYKPSLSCVVITYIFKISIKMLES